MSTWQLEDLTAGIHALLESLNIHGHYGGSLWHYTSAQSASKIMASGKLWASDADYLNDTTEMRLLPERLLAVARDRLAERGGLLREAAVWIAKKRASELLTTTYVSSLSSVKDDLSQWRAYADDGAGYAIEFDARALHESNTSAFLDPCRYLSQSEVDLDAQTILETAESFGHSRGGPAGDIQRARFAHEMVINNSLQFVAPFIKSTAYVGEQEVRVAFPGHVRPQRLDDTFHYEGRFSREQGAICVPYMELEAGAAIKSVMVGPKWGGDADWRVRYGLRSYLDTVDRRCLPVSVSVHRYRGK